MSTSYDYPKMLRRFLHSVSSHGKLSDNSGGNYNKQLCHVDLPAIDEALESLSQLYPPQVILHLKRRPCTTRLQYEHHKAPAFACVDETICMRRASAKGNSLFHVTLYYSSSGFAPPQPGRLKGTWFAFYGDALEKMPYLSMLRSYLGAQLLLSYNVGNQTFHVEFIRADSTTPFLHYEFKEGTLTAIDDSFRL